MEKNNEPTYAQIETIYRWICWIMNPADARKAVHWLRSNASRRDVGVEMNRLYELKHQHKLDCEGLFAGKIWEKYER